MRSPYDGQVVGRVPVGTEAHLDAAVAAALARHRGGALPAHERAAILDRAAVALADQREEFARSIAAEAGKPIKTARVEADRAVDTFRFSAAVARTMAGEMIPLDASSAGVGKLGFVQRVPIGVVAAISPFNFPLNLVAHKVAPAIAAGCPVVLKPASATPLTALRLASVLLDEAGLPDGWLNVVTCSGRVANHLVTHDDVAMITFTGSPPVGWGIRAAVPHKRVGLELGNNAPVVIEPDGDWAGAARKISVAGYSFAGQSCISVQRVYVHSSIADAFLDELVTAVKGLKVGDPMDDDTDVSALIDAGETERVHTWIDDAVAEGATVAAGGQIEGTRAGPDRADRRAARHGGVPQRGVRPGGRRRHLRRLLRGAAPGQRQPLRVAGGRVHQRHRQGPRGRPHARLRRRDDQRGADLARRPDALRRPPRLGQHPRRPGLGRSRDDRGAPGRHPAVTIARTACPLDCPDGCTLEVEVVDGRLVRVDAPGRRADGVVDPGVNPMTQGFICKKVKHHPERVYSPHRVQTPLIRTGPKGSGTFRPASWDEALDLVADRVREALADDPATVVPYLYNSSAGELSAGPLSRLLWRELGASAVHHTICAATAGKAWDLTFGSMLGADLLDVVHAQLVVVWGANPAISNTHLPPLINLARQAGATLVVVDPRRTGSARRADLHLAPRPGTDVVLAMAVAAELERRGLVDRGFTDVHAAGVDEYLAACAEWTLDRAASTCDVPADEIHVVRRPVGLAPAGLLATGLGDRAQPQRRVGDAGGAGLAGAHGRLRRARLRRAPAHRSRRRMGHGRVASRRPRSR